MCSAGYLVFSDMIKLFQQNIVARAWATDTAAHMSANVRQEMLYPVVGFTRLVAGGPIVMVGWIFLSDDLKHDFFMVNRSYISDRLAMFKIILD